MTTDQLTTTTVLCESDFCALPIDTLRKIDHFLLMELRLIFLRAVHTTFTVKLTCIHIRAIFHTFIRMQINKGDDTNFKFSELCPVNLHHED